MCVCVFLSINFISNHSGKPLQKKREPEKNVWMNNLMIGDKFVFFFLFLFRPFFWVFVVHFFSIVFIKWQTYTNTAYRESLHLSIHSFIFIHHVNKFVFIFYDIWGIFGFCFFFIFFFLSWNKCKISHTCQNIIMFVYVRKLINPIWWRWWCCKF